MKTYIKKEKKWNFVITLITIVVVMVIIAIIELMPSRAPELGSSEMNGVGRAFMFPFVFKDDKSNLYVMYENNDVKIIDDATADSLHDSVNGKIYYIKNNALYEYSIKSDSRSVLCENIVRFDLIGNRRAIVCTNTSNELLLYLFKGSTTQKLSAAPADTSAENKSQTYVVSTEGVLYAEGSKLIYADYTGKMYTITEHLNLSKKFDISEDASEVSYFEDNTMIVAHSDGKVIKKIENGQIIRPQKEPVLVSPTTVEKDSNGGIPFKYFLGEISTVENGANETYTTASLQYKDGNNMKSIAANVHSIIHYSKEDDLLLYSVLDHDRLVIYKSSKGGKPVKQINCGVDVQFIFDNRTNYLYYREAGGSLYRYDIYDVKLKTAKIAENCSAVYDYYNKPYIAYDSADHNETFLVLKNKIERIHAKTEQRLYGRSNENYLFCRENTDGYMTIDYAVENQLTRIANKAGVNVFFDRDIEYVLYNENSGLYMWHNGQIAYVGEFKDIKAVDITK